VHSELLWIFTQLADDWPTIASLQTPKIGLPDENGLLGIVTMGITPAIPVAAPGGFWPGHRWLLRQRGDFGDAASAQDGGRTAKVIIYFLGGAFCLPPPDGLPVLDGQPPEPLPPLWPPPPLLWPPPPFEPAPLWPPPPLFEPFAILISTMLLRLCHPVPPMPCPWK